MNTCKIPDCSTCAVDELIELIENYPDEMNYDDLREMDVDMLIDRFGLPYEDTEKLYKYVRST